MSELDLVVVLRQDLKDALEEAQWISHHHVIADMEAAATIAMENDPTYRFIATWTPDFKRGYLYGRSGHNNRRSQEAGA